MENVDSLVRDEEAMGVDADVDEWADRADVRTVRERREVDILILVMVASVFGSSIGQSGTVFVSVFGQANPLHVGVTVRCSVLSVVEFTFGELE